MKWGAIGFTTACCQSSFRGGRHLFLLSAQVLASERSRAVWRDAPHFEQCRLTVGSRGCHTSCLRNLCATPQPGVRRRESGKQKAIRGLRTESTATHMHRSQRHSEPCDPAERHAEPCGLANSHRCRLRRRWRFTGTSLAKVHRPRIVLTAITSGLAKRPCKRPSVECCGSVGFLRAYSDPAMGCRTRERSLQMHHSSDTASFRAASPNKRFEATSHKLRAQLVCRAST